MKTIETIDINALANVTGGRIVPYAQNSSGGYSPANGRVEQRGTNGAISGGQAR